MAGLVDTHCHLNFDAYADDLDAVIQQAQAAGVSMFIVPAIDLDTSREVIALAERYEHVFAAIGIHPNSSKDFTSADIDTLRNMLPHPKVVAIGEIGLDYHWDFSPPDAQHTAFRAQLSLATDVGLPVIIHNRKSDDDTLQILSEWQPADSARPGVMHSFGAPSSHAKRAIDLGFYLGFTGPVTYKKAEETRQISASIPLDRLLVETDSPYLTPEPYRGKRNTPAHIPLIVERLAAVRGIPTNELAQASTENALRLFKLPSI